MARASASAALVSALGGCAASLRVEPTTGARPRIDAHARFALFALQDVLLPGDGDLPSARQVRAGPYLLAAVRDPLVGAHVARRVVDGAAQLDELADDSEGALFADLDMEQRERCLRRLESTSNGHDFLVTVLAFTLEALLGDPVHGGNPGSTAWSALGHRPGFPRPTS